MDNVGPALLVSAIGLILWLAVEATVAGISIQTIGVILFLAGIAWLLISLVQARVWARERVEPVAYERTTPVVREREIR